MNRDQFSDEQIRKESEKALYIDAEFAPESLNEEKRTVESVFTTSRKVLRFDRQKWEYFYEELSLDPSHIVTERVDKGIPVLDNHDRFSGVRDLLGKAKGLAFKDGIPYTTLRFSRKEVAQVAFQDVADGIVDKTSIGYHVHEYVKKDETLNGLEVRLATKWEPIEISLVPIPADIDAQIRSKTPTRQELENKKNNNEEINNDQERKSDQGEEMSGNNTTTEQPKAPELNAEEVRNEGIRLERERATAIKERCEKLGLSLEFREKLINDGISLEKARDLMIDEVEKRNKTPEVNPVKIEVGPSAEEVRNTAVEGLVKYRSGLATELVGEARHMASMSLLEICRMYAPEGTNAHDIAKRALASSDFISTVDTTSQLALAKGFEEARQTFQPFVTQGTLKDYRELTRVTFGATPNLDKVREGQEYTRGEIDDSGEKISISKRGKIISLTEEAIINDSLDYLKSIKSFGNSAARAESDEVYRILTGSVKMSDGKELFHASHNNLVASGVFDETKMDAVYQLFAQVKTRGKNASPVNLEPEFIVAGADNRLAIMKMLAAINPNNSADVNVFAGSLTPIFDARMYGQGWRVLSSKDQITMIELAYLEGMRGPVLETKYNFNNDTIDHKIKHVFGASPMNYEGMVSSPKQ